MAVGHCHLVSLLTEFVEDVSPVRGRPNLPPAPCRTGSGTTRLESPRAWWVVVVVVVVGGWLGSLGVWGERGGWGGAPVARRSSGPCYLALPGTSAVSARSTSAVAMRLAMCRRSRRHCSLPAAVELCRHVPCAGGVRRV